MPGQPSFYFTLFKKFQLMSHAYDGSTHVAGSSLGGFGADDSGLAAIRTNWLNPGSTIATSTALFNILNAKVLGQAMVPPGLVGAGSFAMPQDTEPGDPWDAFQLSAAPGHKLLDVFSSWIADGSPDDSAVAARRPSPAGAADPGVVKVFVQNAPGDDGTDPLPPNWWAAGQIFLVLENGNPFTGSQLNAGDELYLVAVVGNRGANRAGRWQQSAVTASPPALPSWPRRGWPCGTPGSAQGCSFRRCPACISPPTSPTPTR